MEHKTTMIKKLLAACVIVTLCNCAGISIKEVDMKGLVGNELRGHEQAPADHRFSTGVGVEAKLENDVKAGFMYRNRVTDFEYDTMEHGFFGTISVPLYRKD